MRAAVYSKKSPYGVAVRERRKPKLNPSLLSSVFQWKSHLSLLIMWMYCMIPYVILSFLKKKSGNKKPIQRKYVLLKVHSAGVNPGSVLYVFLLPATV